MKKGLNVDLLMHYIDTRIDMHEKLNSKPIETEELRLLKEKLEAGRFDWLDIKLP
jgi:hypothetical protein